MTSFVRYFFFVNDLVLNFIIPTFLLFAYDRKSLLHVWGRGEVCTWFWWGNLRESDHFGDPGVRWEDNIKMDLQEVGYGEQNGSSWLRMGTGGGHV
jgi:hypothetical protein